MNDRAGQDWAFAIVAAAIEAAAIYDSNWRPFGHEQLAAALDRVRDES